MSNDSLYKKKEILEKRIIVFTSNFQGGIIQFTMYLATVLEKQNYIVIVAIPDDAKNIKFENKEITVFRYRRYKNLMINNKYTNELKTAIIGYKPDLVIFCDEGIISLQTALAIKDICKTAMYIHDVKQHLSKFNTYNFLKEFFRKKLQNKTLDEIDLVILLSKNSYDIFNTLYPVFKNKAEWMPLCAHIPEVEMNKPVEFGDTIKTGYYLFFGRFDKYKGIFNLLQAYNSIKAEEKTMLVIAGAGELRTEEKDLIKKNKNVFLVNRFIQDGEMLYLIQNSRTVILPYIEATQSGVIPIAYYFGIPVISSNVPGLIEFVEDGVTGIVCSNITEMKEALLRIKDDELHEKLSKGAYNYHKEKLNWEINVKRCIDIVLN